MTLHTKILDAARDEVAKKYGWKNWSEIIVHDLNNEAALLAMDRQWSFSMWIRSAGYKKMSDSLWANRRTYEKHTTEQLYNIWREEK